VYQFRIAGQRLLAIAHADQCWIAGIAKLDEIDPLPSMVLIDGSNQFSYVNSSEQPVAASTVDGFGLVAVGAV
jgi:hypothetical protein